MKAHFGMTSSGFSRSAITRSTLCLSIATALALPVAIPAITPSTAVEQTAEKRDSAFYNGDATTGYVTLTAQFKKVEQLSDKR